MATLLRLLAAGWRASLLLLVLLAMALGTDLSNNFHPPLFGVMAWLALVAIVILLPDKTQKNAVLLGVGNAFCVIPILHLFFYNSLTDKIVGWGWRGMAPSFGWTPLLLSFVGLGALNVWYWKRSRGAPEKLSSPLAVAAVIIFLLTLAPFCAELVGNLSIRELYSMPTSEALALQGEARNHFLVWKFVDVLDDSILTVANLLPFFLILVVSAGTFAIHWIIRKARLEEPSTEIVYPSERDLPWAMTVMTAGISWLSCLWVEPPFSERLREAERGGLLPVSTHGGLEVMILTSAALFLICVVELMHRLRQAARVRLFYAWSVFAIQFAIVTGLLLLPPLLDRHAKFHSRDLTAQPEWLSWLLVLAVALPTFRQAQLISRKTRDGACEVSIWKYEGKDLVPFGLLLGSTLACSGLMLWLVALVMAFESVTMIRALIAWGNFIKTPYNSSFDPRVYTLSDRPLFFWIAAGLNYFAFCLALGLAVSLLLSGLEFIRFQGVRLYRSRKAAPALAARLAVDD